MESENLTFGGLENFDYQSSDFVIFPVCYEKDVSYGKGADTGALHLLKASDQLEAIDEETLTDFSRFKIHTTPPLYPKDTPEKSVKEIEKKSFEFFKDDKFLLTLGGDHSVAIGPATAAAKTFKNIGILQIDAHSDLRDIWNKSRYNHACTARRIHDETGVFIYQVGIRSFSIEEVEYAKKHRIKQLPAHNINLNDNSWIDSVIKDLPENVYLTIDLDGLDPSVIPGTGTPEPGGLMYRQLTELIKKVSQKRNIVGADICELVKIEGQQVSEYTAAKIAMKILVNKNIF